MFHGLRRVTIAAVSALTLGIGVAVWVTSSASAAPAATPRCPSSSLAVWVDGSQSNGAAGTIETVLELTNITTKACTLYGYPGVSAVNGSGKQLGDAASRYPLFKAKTVTVPADGTVHADLFWSDGEVYTAPGCKRVTASEIKVYPPNDKAAQFGYYDVPVCSATKHPYLSVTVVRPGPRIDD